MPTGPLEGVKVLDRSIALTGPYAAALMADQGAEVIKVERPDIGDIARYVGVAVNGMSFYRPVAVGDAVCVYGNVRRLGNASMEIGLEVWVRPIAKGTDEHYRVTEAIFTYVAIDAEGKPRPLPKS